MRGNINLHVQRHSTDKRKAQLKLVCTLPKLWQHHWCFLGLRQTKRGGTEIPTNLKENWDSVALRMVDTFKCHTSHPILPATEPLSLGQLRNGGRNYHFQGTVDSKTILIKTFLARCLFGICNRIFQLYET